MHESFGARLRRHREEQQIALATIAEQTRIKLTLLEDLERDDVSHWPAGIFRRAFIRSYANAVGLDPDVTVREFAEAHPSPADVASAAAIAAAIEREGANGKAASPFRSFMASLGLTRTSTPGEPAPTPQPAWVQSSRPAASTSAPVPAAPPSFEMSEPDAPLSMPLTSNSLAEEFEEATVDPILEQIADRVNQLPLQMAADSPFASVEEAAPLKEPIEPAVKEPVAPEPDFMAFAQLCTEFGCVDQADDVARLLREVARLMDASGMIVWVWDGIGELRPAMTHGYSRRVVAQLPGVCPEDDNATAAAFRSGQPCVINGGEQSSAALVLPLMAPGGSAGVLAIELQQGRRLTKSIRAVATIFAALMAQLVGAATASDEQGMDHDVSMDHPLAAFNG